jgi:formiminotetrahydrofolate cyclodeaminase
VTATIDRPHVDGGYVPDLDAFLQSLASADPVPGGGSVAALQAALAASLLAMVANLTLGKKRYEHVQERVRALRDDALALSEEARRLIDEDAEAYGAVARAMALPRDGEEEKAERRATIQAALKDAAEPPIRTMRVASRVLDLAGELAEIGNRSAISDVGSAAEAARAGYEAAKLNVEINLAAVRDEAWVADTRARMNEIPSAAARAQETAGRTLALIRG